MGTPYQPGIGVTAAGDPAEEIPVEEATPAPADQATVDAQASADAAAAERDRQAMEQQGATADEVPVEDAAPADTSATPAPSTPAPADQSTIDYQAEVDAKAAARDLAYTPKEPLPAVGYDPVVDPATGELVADPRMAEQDRANWAYYSDSPTQTVEGRQQLEQQGEQILQAREDAKYGLDEQGNPLPQIQDQGTGSWWDRLTPFDEIGNQIAGQDGLSKGDVLNPLNLIKGAGLGTLEALGQIQYREVEWIGDQAYRKQTGQESPNLDTAEKIGLLPATISAGLSTVQGVVTNVGDAYMLWATDPANKELVTKVYEGGYNGYGGGRALWEYYQNETGKNKLQRALNDIGADPLTWGTAVAGAAAKGAETAGLGLARGLGAIGVPAPVARGVGKATQVGLEKLPYVLDPTETIVPAARLGTRKLASTFPAVDAALSSPKNPINYLTSPTADALTQQDAGADTQLFAELAAQARRQGGLSGDAGSILEPIVTPSAVPGGATRVEIRMPDGSVVPFDPAVVLDNLARLDLADYQPELRKWMEYMKVGNPYGLPHTLDTLFPTTRTGGTAAYNNYIDLMAKRVLRYGEDVYDGMYNDVARSAANAARRPGEWWKVGYQLDTIQNVQRRAGVPYTAGGDAAALLARQNLDIRWRNEAIRNSAPRPGRPTPPITYRGPMPWTPNPGPLPVPRGPFDSGNLIFTPEDVARLSRDVKGQPVYRIVDQARRDLEEARNLAGMTARNPAQQGRLDAIFAKYNVPGVEIRGATDAARWAELDDATIDAMSASWARREVEIASGLRTKTGSMVDPAYYKQLNKVFPKFGSALKLYDRVSNTPRTLLLYNYLNAPGFFGRQVIGNAATLGITGERGTLRNYFQFGDWNLMRQRASGGVKAIDTAADQIRRDSGLGSASALRRGGPLPDAATANDTGLTRWLAPKHLRALVEIPDLQVREAVWRTRFQPLHAQLRENIRQHAVDRASTFGVSVTRGQVDNALDALEADVFSRTGRMFYSPEQLREALQRSGASAPTPEALRDWADRVSRDFLGAREADAATGFKGLRAIDEEALKEAQRVGFGGPETRADAILSRIFFYHTWSSRAGLTYARELMRNPVLGEAYYRAVEGLNREAEQENYPPFLRGTIRFMGSNVGFNAYVRGPEVLFGSMLTFAEDQFRDPNAPEFQRQSELGKLVDRAPFMVNPWLATMLYVPGLMGADAQAPSPLGTSGMWGRIIDGYNLVRAAQDQPLVPRSWRPEPAVLNVLANMVSGWAREAGLPVDQVSKVNWDAQTETNRRWFVQQVLRDSHPDWSEDEILAEAMEIQDDLDNPVTQAAIDLEAQMPYGGPRFTGTLDNAPEALRNIAGGLYQALGPLPATVRPAIKDANQAARGDIAQLRSSEGLSQEEAIAKLGLTPEEADRLYLANETVNAANTDVLGFKRTLDAYIGYGTPEQKRLDGIYEMVAGGTLSKPITANGRTWTPEEVAALPEDRRKQLARVYLADQGKLEDWQAYKDGKESFKQANPEVVGYYDYKNLLSGYEGGPSAWAEQTRTGNRSLNLYIQEQEQADPDTRPLTPAERRTLPADEVARRDKARNGMLTSADAFLAASGQARTVYDVNDPRPSGDYGPYYAGVPAGMTPSQAAQQGGGQEQSTYEQYRSEQTQYLEQDIQNFSGMVQIMNDWDAQVGNPIGATRDDYMARLLTGNKKISIPDPVYTEIKNTYEYVWPTKGKLKDYLNWYLDPNANPGGSESIDDFLDYDSLQNARQDLEKPIPVPGSDQSLAALTGNAQKVYGADGTWSLGLREQQAPASRQRQVTVTRNTPLLIDYNNPLAQAGTAVPGLPLVDLNQPAVGRDRNFRLVEGPDGQRFWVDAALLKAA